MQLFHRWNLSTLINQSGITVFCIAVAFLTAACDKVVDLDLATSTDQLVIEGNLTDEKGLKYVKLSESTAFANTNTYAAVSGAIVTLTEDSSKTYTLAEGTAGTYVLENYAGISGHTYTLQVKVKGTSYTATSSLPQKIWIESLAAKSRSINGADNQKEITVSYHDPSVTVNQYNFLMYVNGVQVKSVFAFSDQLTDGNYTTATLTQDDIEILTGDTVIVEMQCVDKAMYTYWHTLMQQDESNGTGVSSADPPNDISPTTLGYFSAHTVERKAIIVP